MNKDGVGVVYLEIAADSGRVAKEVLDECHPIVGSSFLQAKLATCELCGKPDFRLNTSSTVVAIKISTPWMQAGWLRGHSFIALTLRDGRKIRELIFSSSSACDRTLWEFEADFLGHIRYEDVTDMAIVLAITIPGVIVSLPLFQHP